MTIRSALVGICIALAAVTACSTSSDPQPAPPVSSTTTPLPTTSPTTTTETTTPLAVPTAESPITTVLEPTAARYIVSCQTGLGPVETYWSDGTVTGYSDYCQAQHDQVLRSEAEANTPICDGAICRYPSGATRPDTSATTSVRIPSPWVQGQIDWTNCIEAGNSEDYCRTTLN